MLSNQFLEKRLSTGPTFRLYAHFHLRQFDQRIRRGQSICSHSYAASINHPTIVSLCASSFRLLGTVIIRFPFPTSIVPALTLIAYRTVAVCILLRPVTRSLTLRDEHPDFSVRLFD